MKQHTNTRIIAVAVLFFLSGAAGLIYQITWERLLEIYFGVTMAAITLIVAAYMAGLGFGSLIGGRIAHRIKRVVLTYGLVELAIALFGFLSPSLIIWLGERTAGSSYPVVFLLSFSVLLIPTFLMGMTLPLLTQSFVSRVESSGAVIGLLYGINTLGAGCGAFIAGYVLIGWAGLDGATNVAVILNVLVGIFAVVLLRETSTQPSKSHDREEPTAVETLPYHVILVTAFLVGFINLGFEMLWFRVLGILNKATVYNFPSVLFVFLVGLAIGGFVWGKKADASPDPVALFWRLQLWSGLTTGMSFLVFWAALHVPALQAWVNEMFTMPQQPQPAYVWTDNGIVLSRILLVKNLAVYFLPILILVLPASLIMGGGLPVLDRIAITSANQSGKRVGDIHLANIVGSLAGSLSITFVFLPSIGTELTLKLLAVLNLFFTVLVWKKNLPPTTRYALPVGLVVLLLVLPWRGAFYTQLYETGTGIQTSIYETSDSVLALNGEVANPSKLWIGGIQNSYYPTYGHYERATHTCASVSQPKRILIIGLGGANTAYFLTQAPGVEQIVIVELMTELGPLLNEQAPVATKLFADPRVSYIGDDGRRYLYANPDELFDLIFIDPLNSFSTGHNNLYSKEAMQLYQAHLTENGVFCAWFNENHVIPNTVAQVFPHTTHFRDFIVAGNQPQTFDRAYMDVTLDTYARNSIGLYSDGLLGTLSQDAIFEHLLANRTCTLENEKESATLTDLNPWLEYYLFHPPVDFKITCENLSPPN